MYTSFTEHCKTEAVGNQLPDLVDYDEYDAKVFRNPSGYSALRGYPPLGSGFRRIRSAMEIQRMAKSASKDELVYRRASSPPRGVSFEDLDINSSSLSMLVVSGFGELGSLCAGGSSHAACPVYYTSTCSVHKTPTHEDWLVYMTEIFLLA